MKKVKFGFNPETIGKSNNPDYYSSLFNNLKSWFEFNNLEIDWDWLEYKRYDDTPKSLIYHRPHKFKTIIEGADEDSGCILHFALKKDKMTPEIMVLLMELLERLRWGNWPDSEYEPTPLENHTIANSCWHHTAIIHNRAFCQEPILLIELQMGFCYCS